MTFPGTDAWYLDNVLGLIRNEKHEPIVWIMNLEDGERIITEHNALAGLDPAKLAALIEAADERDAALKRVAELEKQAASWSVQAFGKALDERDALAAELVELRGRTIQHILDLVPHSPHCNGGRTFYLCGKCDVTERINKEFAAQSQGERGAQILAVVEAARAWKELYEAYIPSLLDPPLAAAQKKLFAAIAGAQPE